MRIGILGPTKIENFCRLKGIPMDYFIKSLEFLASHFAVSPHTFYIVPDVDSTAYLFAQNYRKNDGHNVVGLAPLDDKEFGHHWLDLSVATETHNTGTWRNTPEELVKQCDVLICIGLGLGSMIEIAYSRWYKVNKVYLIKEFVPKLPIELTHKIHCQWVTINELVQLIK
ncbi:hypothetical protein COV93_01895 [Candidatus Woesearchaeota archaeon CG11_big_fil_rev_8_21_14_0_20_43_8]|nr:MAG: hypothetical protein COV93_01895 [Candidatus Woesearchaeota archaeon CG11_big_fil_rev_8_21_14_0_20_43_8]PIO05682.1 MAG: hypothetical protein COT47_03700 [Candidatus Woesearchaeota archaeon CG08_land_8_20_14_0_20_43_7]